MVIEPVEEEVPQEAEEEDHQHEEEGNDDGGYKVKKMKKRGLAVLRKGTTVSNF